MDVVGRILGRPSRPHSAIHHVSADHLLGGGGVSLFIIINFVEIQMFVHLSGYRIVQCIDAIYASRQQALPAHGTMSESESRELSRSSGYLEIYPIIESYNQGLYF